MNGETLKGRKDDGSQFCILCGRVIPESEARTREAPEGHWLNCYCREIEICQQCDEQLETIHPSVPTRELVGV